MIILILYSVGIKEYFGVLLRVVGMILLVQEFHFSWWINFRLMFADYKLKADKSLIRLLKKVNKYWRIGVWMIFFPGMRVKWAFFIICVNLIWYYVQFNSFISETEILFPLTENLVNFFVQGLLWSGPHKWRNTWEQLSEIIIL